MHKQNRGMVEGPLFSGMMFYTIPIIISGILQLLFNAADLVIVGQFGQSGSNAVAAVGCTGAISALIINFFIGFSAGSGVTVAHAIGAKDSDYVHKAVHTIIPLAIIGGTVISVIGVFLAEPLLILMDTPAEILPLAITYMQIIFAGTLPNVVYNFGSSVLRAAGDSKRPLYFLLIAGVINLGLNLIFVLCLKMDIAGVALATIISYLVSAVLVVFALIKRQDDCKLNLKKIRFHPEPLKKIFRMGFPAGIQSSIFSVSNVIIQTSLNGLDAIPQYAGVVAGSAAATNIQNFAFMTNEGFRQTAMNYIGQNSAAGRFDRVRKISHICFMSTAVLGVIVGILLTIFSKPLLSIYITDSPQAVYWGSVRMMYICLPFFIAGLMDVTTGVLRGLGQSVFPMIASIMGICVLRVAWIYTIFKIPAFHTPESLFISYIISWVLTFIVQYVVIKIVINKKLRAHKR
ncbi:MAG: MATE family efflux transporter [Ruminococcaceae bacterium]|nr:MATE family efflux transporter [Oscillospiraceae bacterium]